jgi:hypothetical protein
MRSQQAHLVAHRDKSKQTMPKNNNATVDDESLSINSEKDDDMRESGSSSGYSGTGNTFQESRQVAGSEQTKGVIRLKLSVLFVMISSAIGVSVFTYSYLKHVELKSFQTEFDDDASKILEAIGSNIDTTLSALDSIAVTLVSHAQATNQTWPFVTLPNFAVRMAKVLPQSHAVILNVIPVVTPEQRDEWEKYSVENDGWVNDNMAVQKEWGKFYGPIVFDGEPNTVLQGDFGVIEPNASRFHLPTWQNFPVLANVSAPVDRLLRGLASAKRVQLTLQLHFLCPHRASLADFVYVQLRLDVYVHHRSLYDMLRKASR